MHNITHCIAIKFSMSVFLQKFIVYETYPGIQDSRTKDSGEVADSVVLQKLVQQATNICALSVVQKGCRVGTLKMLDA